MIQNFPQMSSNVSNKIDRSLIKSIHRIFLKLFDLILKKKKEEKK